MKKTKRCNITIEISDTNPDCCGKNCDYATEDDEQSPVCDLFGGLRGGYGAYRVDECIKKFGK